ncbi:exosortase/archaeosortase family protein [Candidatus Omnitrophota bacterium]
MSKNYLKIALIALIVGVIYIPTFIWMWGRWFAEESYYSHGILMPLVTIFLILFKKDELKNLKPIPNKIGILLILIGAMIYLISAWMRVYFTSGLSLILLILGLVLYFLGKVYLRKLLYPILFLLFMVPMPMVLVANLTVKLKLFATQCATAVLNKIGIFAVRDGSIIRTMHSYMMVEAPCSGLRSLISLLALGALIAYFMKTSVVKKWILVFLSMPIAICANVFRVSLLTAVNEIYGKEFAMGWFHDFSGFLLFFVALIGLMVTKKLVE